MKIRGLNDYDIVNYRQPTMFIVFPYCSFKCDKEAGIQVCQNSKLAKEPIIEMSEDRIIQMYKHNPLLRGIVCGGLEPFDSMRELSNFLYLFRLHYKDPIIIYTGYTETEAELHVSYLKPLGNLIIKFGRFIPNRPSRYDEILGVTLASDNQYAKYYE